jgi:phage I-like protein
MMKIQAFKDEQGRLTLLLKAPEGANPPPNFIILKKGKTDTTKGTILFDDKSAKDVMAFFSEKGLDQLPIDFNHGMLSIISTPEGSKAAGWFTPSVEDGNLVANDVEWTPMATSALKNREFRFFSPALGMDPETGRVKRLINVALTNLPATNNQTPLVAHDVGADRPPKGQDRGHMSEILKALGAQTEAEAVAMIGRRTGVIALLLSATNAANADDALAQITEWKTEAAEAVKLAEKVRTLETERSNAERAQLIVELNDAGKLPESLHSWAKTQTLDSLKAFGESAPVAAKHTNYEPADGKTVVLSDEEVNACRHLGMTRAEFSEAKEANEKAEAEHRAKLEGTVL